MQPKANVLTNVRLIRDFSPADSASSTPLAPAAPRPSSPERSQRALVPERAHRLIERWEAPVMSEEEIEAWAPPNY